MHGQSLYPFSDQYGAKTIPFGAVHTYMTYKKDYTPGGGGIIKSQMQAVATLRWTTEHRQLGNKLMLPNLLSEKPDAYIHFPR